MGELDDLEQGRLLMGSDTVTGIRGSGASLRFHQANYEENDCSSGPALSAGGASACRGPTSSGRVGIRRNSIELLLISATLHWTLIWRGPANASPSYPSQ